MIRNIFSLLTINMISIYALSDLGAFSNLIGSLSRTIQQRVDNVRARCFFPMFLENDLSKVDKILELTFFLRQEKSLKDCKRFFFFHFL